MALRVGKDFGVREVCEAAVKKHSDHDQFFCGDEDYILLYPDQKAVVKVPGNDENFTVAKYKQELAKPYSKCIMKCMSHSSFALSNSNCRKSENTNQTHSMCFRRVHGFREQAFPQSLVS